jgi:hypothetical protein
MKLKACVREHTGRTVHSVGTIVDGKLVPVEKLQPASWVELDEADEHFFLYRFSQAGDPVGDTWHETLKDAKKQAHSEFGIQESDWMVVIRLWDVEAVAKGPKLEGGVQDVPDSRFRPGETDLEWGVRMLLQHLQTLAADAETLLRAYPPNCDAVSELVNGYAHYLELSKAVVEQGLVGEGYWDKARLVERTIMDMSDRYDPELWTDDALRSKPEWEEIRRLAKEALAAMGHEFEPPPAGSM